MARLLAIDTSYVLYRSFYGIPDRFLAPDGTPVNAVRGCLDAVSHLVETYRPSHLVCAWDADWRPAWRVEHAPSYKAHRVVREVPGGVDVEDCPERLQPQFAVAWELLRACGVNPIGVADHEADDVLASYARNFDGETIVATGDRDLFQVIDASTTVAYLGKGVAKHVLLEAHDIEARYGVHPECYASYAALRGDPSDGLPGVAGIGEKTAAQLLHEYGSLEELLRAAEDPNSGLSPAQRRRLLAAAPQLPGLLAVVTAVDTLRVPAPTALPLTVADGEQVAHTWGLQRSYRRLREALSASGMEEIDR